VPIASRKYKHLPKVKALRSKLYRILAFAISPLVLGTIYYLVSYYLFVPKIEVNVREYTFENPSEFGYEIIISNPSNRDLNNFNFAFRFTDNFSIKQYSTENVNRNTAVVLRSREDITIRDAKTYQMVDPSIFLMNGFRGYADILRSGTTFSINVVFDKTYDKRRGSPFPQMSEPTLFPNTYFYMFQYNPLGFLSPISITKKCVYTFDGSQSVANNYRSYTQYLIMSNGELLPMTLTYSHTE